MFPYFVIFIWACCWIMAAGQGNDSTIVLSEVPVVHNRLKQFATGSKIISCDSNSWRLFSFQNLSDYFSQQNMLFIRNYGPGNLGLISFRGTSPNHTAVLWNGLPIQSPLHGQSDLSLIPAFFFAPARVQFGGGGSLFGSGAVGGALHLSSAEDTNRLTIQAGGGLGSFHTHQPLVGVSFNTNKLFISCKNFYSESINNFEYLRDNSERVKQINAGWRGYGTLTSLRYSVRPRTEITGMYWGTQFYRQIPNVLQSPNSSQVDVTHRIHLGWKYAAPTWSHAIKTMLSAETIDFTSIAKETFSNSSKSITIEYESKWSPLPNFNFNWGIHALAVQANGDNLQPNVFLFRPAWFAAIAIKSLREIFTSVLSFRQPWDYVTPNPLIPSWGNEVRIVRKLFVLKSQVSRNYRMPTVNDLYWRGGDAEGNRQLQPEIGWSYEAGLESQHELKRFQYKVNLQAYESYIQNWIYWSHSENNILKPQNILKVKTQGFEWGADFKFRMHKFIHLQSISNFDLNLATIQQSKNQNSVGKQMIYVPYNKWFTMVTLSIKNLRLTYTHQYTGFRYYTEDNMHFLAPFHIGNFSVQGTYVWNNTYKMDAYLKINNPWNEDYQILKGRPMPLMHFQSGLIFTYFK